MRVALSQMLVEGGKPDQNRNRAIARIQKAAETGADLVLLPEALDFGWTDPSAHTGTGPIPGGETYEGLSRAVEARPARPARPVARPEVYRQFKGVRSIRK